MAVDLDKSDVVATAQQSPQSISELAYVCHNDIPVDPKEQAPPAAWSPETPVAPELREAIRDLADQETTLAILRITAHDF